MRGRGYRLRGRLSSLLQDTDVGCRSVQARESEQQPLQGVEACRAVRPQAALGGRLDDRAVRGVGQMGTAPRTLLGDLGELGERAQDVRGIDVPQAERPDTGGVDDPPVAAVAAVSYARCSGEVTTAAIPPC